MVTPSAAALETMSAFALFTSNDEMASLQSAADVTFTTAVSTSMLTRFVPEQAPAWLVLVGQGSHKSPSPSASRSCWSEFFTVGQLSQASPTKSLSVSRCVASAKRGHGSHPSPTPSPSESRLGFQPGRRFFSHPSGIKLWLRSNLQVRNPTLPNRK